MEGIFKLAGAFVTGLIVLAVIALVLGHKPKPCPPHICFPKSKIVSAEALIAQRAEDTKTKRIRPIGER